MLDRLKLKKEIIVIGLLGVVLQAKAEVLVILPESGPMARASNSIKMGLVNAHRSVKSNQQLKFVNSDQTTMKQILRQNVTKSTDLIIGPLARNEVESLIKEKPSVPVLSLNEVNSGLPNVLQFSLSKDDDANALLNQINKDKIQQIFVIREKGTEKESSSFINALFRKYPKQVTVVDQIPNLEKNDGLLLLGSDQWVQSLKNKPAHHVYIQANSVSNRKDVPRGIKFCDVPMIYSKSLKFGLDIKSSATDMPYAYQRLYAFGFDSWQIAEQLIANKKAKKFEIQGLTGYLKVSNQRIEREPACYEKKWLGYLKKV